MILAGTVTGSIQTAKGGTRRPIRWLREQENNTDIAYITGGDISYLYSLYKHNIELTSHSLSLVRRSLPCCCRGSPSGGFLSPGRAWDGGAPQ